MRKAEPPGVEELRAEYKRSDFGPLQRGKYAERLQARSNIVVVDLRLTDLFPNAESVKAALRSLAEIAERSAQAPVRAERGRRRHVN